MPLTELPSFFLDQDGTSKTKSEKNKNKSKNANKIEQLKDGAILVVCNETNPRIVLPGYLERGQEADG